MRTHAWQGISSLCIPFTTCSQDRTKTDKQKFWVRIKVSKFPSVTKVTWKKCLLPSCFILEWTSPWMQAAPSSWHWPVQRCSLLTGWHQPSLQQLHPGTELKQNTNAPNFEHLLPQNWHRFGWHSFTTHTDTHIQYHTYGEDILCHFLLSTWLLAFGCSTCHRLLLATLQARHEYKLKLFGVHADGCAIHREACWGGRTISKGCNNPP